MKNKFLIVALVCLTCSLGWAKENEGIPGGKLSGSQKLEAGDCAPASSSVDLDINNIRARIQNGGDMWWDLVNNAKYEVPKSLPGQPENASSMFAGAVWIGGVDAQGQLKVAAATYRQNGNDFFPGPLDEDASIDQATCKQWDKHFEVLGTEIDSFLQLVEELGNVPSGQIPKDILNWPAYGNPWNPLVGNRNLAPFEDADNNGYYDPTGGDYPVIDQTCTKKTYADQMIWWVYNDKGNIHTETGATAIGMEVQALAFAFKTNDEVNDMTFYKYKLLNKASVSIDSTFMGQWADPDLGCYVDDYIGCDLETGLGIVYNGQAVDGGSACALSYGNQPPYEGIDYFQGPLDENGQQLGMSSFLYYVNDFSVIGNPENAGDYYGYLSGTWKDGSPFTSGGNAYAGSVPTNFVFPDDPSNSAGWSQCAAQVPFADQRFIQSSGPFRLDPGATNEIVIGVVWVRPPIGTYPCPSYKMLKQADQKAQALFDNCFQLKDGPPAPDLSIIELDKELVIALENTKDVESFQVVDPQIAALGIPDSIFKFEGYQLYQLSTANVSTQDYDNPTVARLLFQCDIKNNVSKIVNYYYDASLDIGNPNLVPNVPVLMVDGADIGLQHTLDITTDAFAQGDQTLINNMTYYYSIISYSYNYYQFSDTIRDDQGNVVNIVTTVQQQPYLSGRKNIKVYSGIPHIPAPENSGLDINSNYGDGPEITRQEGSGNGKLVVDLTSQSTQDILASPINLNYHPTYVGAAGPVSISVYNPKVVPNADFELTLSDSSNPTKFLNASTTSWTLKNLTTGVVVNSDFNLDYLNEQLIPDWGLKVYVEQVRNPGGDEAAQLSDNNGFLGSSITFADPQTPWLSGLVDEDGESPFNWIRAGSYSPDNSAYPDYFGAGGIPIDINGVYEQVIGGTWSPYRLAADQISVDVAPAWADALTHGGPSQVLNPLDSICNVDVVITPDRSQWSMCIVVETESDPALAQGGADKMDLRAAPSKDIDGNEILGSTGRSWFPGYAVNPVTGERLNIFFGEDSWLAGQGGKDMIWNPTSEIYTFSNNAVDFLIGGKQYLYITRSKYDSCNKLYTSLNVGTITEKRNAYKWVTWTAVPLLAPNFSYLPYIQGLIPSVATIKIRVVKPYQVYQTDLQVNGGQPQYTFNTANLAAINPDQPTAVQALDTINIVPNPYYAYSAYEVSQLDNRVKITNLPVKCTITIYSLEGNQVRKISRDDNSITSYDWDLKNDAGIPIASGIYIIHIDAPGIGERTMKWFGVMRPQDLNNY